VWTSREGDWSQVWHQRLRLGEARYQRGTEWVRETRQGLLFLHVAKSGGTSLDAFFSNFFPPHEILPTDRQVRRMVEWDDQDWHRYRYFKLEWPHELTAKRSSPLHVVTLLRDPIQRIVSLYKHLRRADDHTQQYDSVRVRRTPEQEAARTLSLAEWARLRPGQPGAYFRHPYLGMATIGVRNLVEKSDAELDTLLDRAKRNLREQFAFVGIIEDYLQSKRLFCRTFGLPLHYAAGEERLNVAPRTPDPHTQLDDATQALLRRENRWDVELYEFARRLFAERCLALEHLPDPALDETHAPSPPRNPPSQGRMEHGIEALPGSGFYPVETSPLGISVRWTGSLPVSTLDLVAAWPARGALEFHLDVVAVVEPERLSELQVRLDGRAPANTRWEPVSTGPRLVARFDLSEDIARRTLHQLELEGPTAEPPTPPGVPRDGRRLGIGLHRVAWTWGGTPTTVAAGTPPAEAA
jgi:hypothetical protein